MTKTITLKDADELRCQCDTDDYTFVAEETDESNQWSEPVTVYIEENSTGKIYGFDYDRGLTEMQETTIDTIESFEDTFYGSNYDHHVALTQYEETTRVIRTFVVAEEMDNNEN